MSDNLLTSKIELLEEQIENIERSGFFTEAEIDRTSKSLRAEPVRLKQALAHGQFNNSIETASESMQQAAKALYGMTAEAYAKGIKYHNECFDRMKNVNNAKPSNELS